MQRKNNVWLLKNTHFFSHPIWLIKGTALGVKYCITKLVFSLLKSHLDFFFFIFPSFLISLVSFSIGPFSFKCEIYSLLTEKFIVVVALKVF